MVWGGGRLPSTRYVRGGGENRRRRIRFHDKLENELSYRSHRDGVVNYASHRTPVDRFSAIPFDLRRLSSRNTGTLCARIKRDLYLYIYIFVCTTYVFNVCNNDTLLFLVKFGDKKKKKKIGKRVG